jgi:hypothetical protein
MDGENSLIQSIEYVQYSHSHSHGKLMTCNGFKFFLKKFRKRLEEFQLFLKLLNYGTQIYCITLFCYRSLIFLHKL